MADLAESDLPNDDLEDPAAQATWFSLALEDSETGSAPRLADDSPHRQDPKLKRHKGIFDLLTKKIRTDCYQQARDEEPAPRCPHIIFDYVDSLDIDVFAYKHTKRDNLYIIALTYAHVKVLELAFNGLLCSHEFWPKFGTIDPAQAELETIWWSQSYETILSDLADYKLTPDHYIPKDPQRQGFAGFLTDMSLQFIFAHELRHILAGHSEYYLCNFQSSISESEEPATSPEGRLKLQAMEWDADCWAVQQVLKSQANLLRSRFPNFDASNPEIQKEWLSVFYTILIAATGFFRFQDDAEIMPISWNTQRHPPLTVRRWLILSHGIAWCRIEFPELFSPEACNSMHVTILKNFEVDIPQVWSGCRDDAYSDLAAKSFEIHQITLLNVWLELIEDLQPISYIKLYPHNLYTPTISSQKQAES
jgi:hypothetical protein